MSGRTKADGGRLPQGVESRHVRSEAPSRMAGFRHPVADPADRNGRLADLQLRAPIAPTIFSATVRKKTVGQMSKPEQLA